MITLWELYERAYRQGIEIDEIRMRELRAVSFPEGWIAIDPEKFESLREYKCVLAHEIGHIETGSFYNVYSKYDLMSKCERKANKRAAEILMPLSEVKAAIRDGCCTIWALAEFFDVTEEFVRIALKVYAGRLAYKNRPALIPA